MLSITRARRGADACLVGWARRAARVMAAVAAAMTVATGPALAQQKQEVVIGIGTQNTTTNTVTGGVAIKELKLLEKYLPRTGKYANVVWKIDWQNFTSGPPVTNGMLANKLQIGMMGDYPLLVNGATAQQSKGNETELIAIIAYNAFGSGNGVVVHEDSPYYQLSDLKGKTISVPFGSAAHGMLLMAMQARGWRDDYWTLVNQSPEIGTTNLQEKKIDAHADFVPFAELLPYRGFARKVFDGVQTRNPTFHGVVVRKDFAQMYPEAVVAYLRALMEANDWVRKDPRLAAQKVQDWTRIEKEVAYLYLGPAGIHTLDPTIKPRWIDSLNAAHGVLKTMGRVKAFNMNAWVNDSYLRQAFQAAGRDYDAQKQTLANYDIQGTDPICKRAIGDPKDAGEIWLQSGEIVPVSSADCLMLGIRQYEEQGKKLQVAYVFDKSLGIKLFADKAFYAVDTAAPEHQRVHAFLLKNDAEVFAAKRGGKPMSYQETLASLDKPAASVAKAR